MKNKYNKELVGTIIGEDCNFKGMLHSQQSIRIDGRFNGEINAKGNIYIGPKSKVKANISGKNITIMGTIEGNIEALSSLRITKTGKVYGNISGDQLNIEEGGIYKGKVNMEIISLTNEFEGKVKLINT